MLVALFDIFEGEGIVLEWFFQMRKLYFELLILDDLVKWNCLFLIRIQEVILIMQAYHHFM